MKKIAALREEITEFESIERRIQDALELSQIEDESLRSELDDEVASIELIIEKLEFESKFTSRFDRGDAILAIHAGAGGTDSQDWTEMLQRMYIRWIEKQGYKADILDTTFGEEAGIKSTTISVDGPYAYGYLKSEKGVHRLVRLSPFDSNNRRHTSFALVEILPQVDDDNEVIIKPDEVNIDVYKSSGAGGQNVQKNATAIRITHLPTGIVVTCQNERSQIQNKENAFRVLRSRLLEIKQLEKERKLAELRGAYTKAEWGSQIRSYILHPYQMVKDHRTNHEEGNAQAVLDGDIDAFIDAYLRSQMGNGE